MTARPTKRLNATEELFAFHCRALKLPPPLREYRFCADRQWRFDFAWPDGMVAVEIEGLVVRKVDGRTQVGGRHASISGMKGDMEKYNHAALMGWRVFRFEQSMVKSGKAVAFVGKALLVSVLSNLAHRPALG